MPHPTQLSRRLIGAMVLLAPVLFAQPDGSAGLAERGNGRVMIGGRHWRATAESDRGVVESNFRMSTMTVMLKRTAAQQADLDRLLAEQRDPASPNYHQWLTPEEFGERFGASQRDFAAVRDWLEGEGFQIGVLARSRTWIQFNGTAAQSEKAFGTEVHRFESGGEKHYANTSAPSVPASLSPVVALVRGLDDFYPRPHSVKRKPLARPLFGPDYNDGGNYLAPGDLATIYDFASLRTQGYAGAGVSVAIVAASDVVLSDVGLYRSTFGLPATTVHVVYDGADPGQVADWYEEGNLDLDVVSGTAPQATIYMVTAADAWNSMIYAVDNNIGQILSMSFGGCEYGSAAFGAEIEAVAQQGNAEGMTLVASSGDTGAAGCDGQGEAAASYGLYVNMPASLPDVTAVGGTRFNEGSGTYWGSTNNANGGSATGYVPENGWNDTAERGGLSATGGGASSIFTKPTWQTGTGVPSDGVRDVPDVAFAASPDHDGYIVIVNGGLNVYGGTSASAPLFAGMLAVLNEYLVSAGVESTPGLGNINPTLYTLAATTTNVFNDVTQGNNIVPCVASSPNCPGSHQMGYSAGPGYDQVTGLGSIDAYNLVQNWPGVAAASGNPAITSLSPQSVVAGSGAFTLTVNGRNFVSGATVNWNGTALTTTFGNASALTAAVPANLVASAGSASVTVTVSGVGTSSAATFTIASAAPTITSLSPNSASMGGAAFTLTVNGTNFVSGATVKWNGASLTTTFSSAIKLTAPITAAMLASPATVSVTVSNPNGATSAAATFSVAAPTPAVTSINPNTGAAGGAAFSMAVSGLNFFSGSTVHWGSTALTTTYISAKSLIASVPASLLTTVGSHMVTVVNPGGATSGAAVYSVVGPSITSVTPNTGPAGGAQFTMTVAGKDFAPGASVKFGNTALATTYEAATTVLAVVPASLLTTPGTFGVSVTNPGGTVSPAAAYSVLGPAITSLNPTTAAAGGAAFSLTVTGRDFAPGATVKWGSTALGTSYLSATTLLASVPASLLVAPGTVSVAVANTSSNVSGTTAFTVWGPSITSLNPKTAPAGGAAFSLTVTGVHFAPGATVRLGGTALATSYLSSTTLLASVPASSLVAPGTFAVSVTNPSNNVSGTTAFTAWGPSITALNPTSGPAGGAAFSLTVTGNYFAPGATVKFGGTALATSYLSTTTLLASVPANLVVAPGTFSVSVTNPSNNVSGAAGYTAWGPSITSVAPTSGPAGGPQFTLTVTGQDFAPGSTVRWGSTALATSYLGPAKLTATVPATLLGSLGTSIITVLNPGNNVSGGAGYSVLGPAITALSATSGPVGGAQFSLTLTGRDFAPGSTVKWGSTSLATSYLAPTTVTATVPATLLGTPGTYSLTVINPGNNISPAVGYSVLAPAITSLSPTSGPVGGGQFTVTVTGRDFAPGSTVKWGSTALATSYLAPTTLSATVPTSVLGTTGTYGVSVMNPGGIASAAAAFSVLAPAISSLSPNVEAKGGGQFTVTVFGKDFAPGSVVKWGTTALSTSYVEATALTAVVPANLLTTAGQFALSVTNPGGAVSPATAFAVH